ncbi:ATP-dependent Clp protease proteolytic subunit-related protein 4, chloroplastic [Primulina tabacum]|uniref:ATP-dependent Clp protease proteolytic subunit-related protein 4, chloroplastic n=1 Tax=Primulina tabacum TaxID=48773 RepID=UPI003F5AC7BF
MTSPVLPTAGSTLSTNPLLNSSSSTFKPSLCTNFLSPIVGVSVSGDFSGQRICPASLKPSSSTSRGRRSVVTTVIPFSRGSAWEQAPPDLASYLYKNRIVYLGMSLVPSVTELILAELLYLQYEDEEKPIYLYINSIGTTKVLSVMSGESWEDVRHSYHEPMGQSNLRSDVIDQGFDEKNEAN